MNTQTLRVKTVSIEIYVDSYFTQDAERLEKHSKVEPWERGKIVLTFNLPRAFNF